MAVRSVASLRVEHEEQALPEAVLQSGSVGCRSSSDSAVLF